MEGIIQLTDAQRKTVLSHFRFGSTARVSRHAHILLLLDRGWSYREIMDAMLCGSDLIVDIKRRYVSEGLESALGMKMEAPAEPAWSETICTWVVGSTPQDFGYFRTRWSCEILSELLLEQESVVCSSETVRRWMQHFGFVWRRPGPIVGPTDPFYDEKMRKIRKLLRGLPANEIAWFAGAIVSGGVIGPVLLMFGLTGMPASGASLLLNAEGVFTALLAMVAVVYALRDKLTRRATHRNKWWVNGFKYAAWVVSIGFVGFLLAFLLSSFLFTFSFFFATFFFLLFVFISQCFSFLDFQEFSMCLVTGKHWALFCLFNSN